MSEHPLALTALRAGERWSDDEDRQLHAAFAAGVASVALAAAHQRSVGGIGARLRRLGLIDAAGVVITPTPPYVAVRRRVSGDVAIPSRTWGGDPLHAVFEASTEEGWHVEVRSNVRLDDEKIDRLSLMLRGAVDRPKSIR